MPAASGDIDFAFVIDSWDQYNQIKQNLLATGKFRDLPKEKQSKFMIR
jgi:predicted nucleotidyltransferase